MTNKNNLGSLLYLFFYIIISTIYFQPQFHDIDTSIFTPGGDQYTFIWFLSWWPKAIASGINPFITNFVWPSANLNLTWTTSIPTLAIIMAPVTDIIGPIASWNILTLLTTPLNAFSAFLLLKYLYKKDIPAFLGGYIFGYSTYVLGQLQGHLNLDMVFIIPLLILIFIKRVRSEYSRKFYITSTVILLSLETGISTEILATSITFGVISILIFLSLLKDYRVILLSALKDTVFSILISMILLSPFFYYLITGTSSKPPLPGSPLYFSADLINYFIPTPITKIGGHIFNDISANFTGNYSEEGAYIGLPIFTITVIALTEKIKNRKNIGLFLLLTLIFISIFSLGQYLHVNGVITNIYLPWKLFTDLPLIRNALPIRFTLYAFLMIAIILTDWMAAKEHNLTRVLFVILAITFIVPNTAKYTWQTPKIPAPFAQTKYLIGKNLLILPFGYTGASMLWQAISDFSFKLVGGYTGSVPDIYNHYMMTSTLLSADPGESFGNLFKNYCRHFKVNYVVICPGTPKKLKQSIVHTAEQNKWQVKTLSRCTLYKIY